MEYKIGQILTSNCETTVEKGISGTKVVIPKGNKIIIGADKMAHHIRNGYVQPLAKDSTVKGYDCEGIAEYIFLLLKRDLPLEDMMDDYDLNENEVKESIECALEEIL